MLTGGRIISTIWGEGERFPGIGPLPTFWPFMGSLGICRGTYGCVIQRANMLQ